MDFLIALDNNLGYRVIVIILLLISISISTVPKLRKHKNNSLVKGYQNAILLLIIFDITLILIT